MEVYACSDTFRPSSSCAYIFVRREDIYFWQSYRTDTVDWYHSRRLRQWYFSCPSYTLPQPGVQKVYFLAAKGGASIDVIFLLEFSEVPCYRTKQKLTLWEASKRYTFSTCYQKIHAFSRNERPYSCVKQFSLFFHRLSLFITIFLYLYWIYLWYSIYLNIIYNIFSK